MPEKTITPKDLADALEGVSNWVLSIRRTVLLLPADTRITMQVSDDAEMARPLGDGCPPAGPQ
ncbi:MAG: hypothetical protein AB7P99_20040 [Vicinamibacterales bacterium]